MLLPYITSMGLNLTLYIYVYIHSYVCLCVVCDCSCSSFGCWKENFCSIFSINNKYISVKFVGERTIGKTPVRIILWCPITKMLIKACFLVQPLEQEGVYQKCCISLCSKVFINHFYQIKASPECLNILTYCSKYWVDRLRRTIGRNV